MTTAEALEGLTGTAEFELFAMSALRELQPEFSLIIQTGINAQGKTIVHPLDGFARIPGPTPRYAAAAATTAQDLRRKWLAESNYDLNALSGEAGDLVKAAKRAADLRKISSDATLRIALVTNREPDDDLHQAVDSYALANSLEYVIVSRGTLANYLDNTDNGNYQREKLFGTLQTRLSWELLQDIGIESLRLFANDLQQTDDQIWVQEQYEDQLLNDTSQNLLTLLVADSGRGKSTLSCRIARSVAASGGVALWCKPEYFGAHISLERILLDVLQAIRPELDNRAGKAALELASRENILLLVDDVNRLPDTAGFCDRLSRRVQDMARDNEVPVRESNAAGGRGRIAFLVPLWTSNAAAFQNLKTPAHVTVRSMKPMSDLCAAEFVARIRVRFSGSRSEVSSSTIALALWNDPFLISTWGKLWELRGSEPRVTDVLQQYVDSLCVRAAGVANLHASEVVNVVQTMGRYILRTKRLQPTVTELLAQFDSGNCAIFRALLRDGMLCRGSTRHDGTAIVFQHDRLRDFILASTMLRAGRLEIPDDAILSDPLFAEVFALALGSASGGDLKRVVNANPLSAAIAVSEHCALDRARRCELETLLTKWWNNPETLTSGANQGARTFASDWWANHAAPVSAILFRNQHSMQVYLAGTRLGDAESAVRLCSLLGFDKNASWRDDALLAGDRRQASALRAGLQRFFTVGLPDDKLREGALWLAGFLGDTNMKDGSLACWTSVTNKTAVFKAAVFAVAQTSRDLIADMEELLDFLVTIDDTRDAHNTSPRYWATHDIPYLLTREPNPQLVLWLRHIVETRPDLQRMAIEIAITRLSADAVPFIVEQFEAIELKHGPQAASLQVMMDRHYFRSAQTVDDVTSTLRRFFQDPTVPPIRRKYAFQFWAPSATVRDLTDLADVPEAEVFGDAILNLRLDLSDQSVVPRLIDKLNDGIRIEWWLRYCPNYWQYPQVRDSFERCLDQHIATFLPADVRVIYRSDDLDYAFVGVLNRLDPDEVERLIAPRWVPLASRNLYLQAALAANTPTLFHQFTERLSDVTNPDSAFEHVSLRLDSEAIRGRAIRIQVLTPFLSHFAQMDLQLIATEANRQLLFAWRSEHVDPLLDEEARARVGTTDVDLLRIYLDNYQRQSGLEMWFHALERLGETAERGIAILREWFVSSGDTGAFQAYCFAVRRNGNRDDVARLESERPADQEQEVAFTRYFVYRRAGEVTCGSTPAS